MPPLSWVIVQLVNGYLSTYGTPTTENESSFTVAVVGWNTIATSLFRDNYVFFLDPYQTLLITFNPSVNPSLNTIFSKRGATMRKALLIIVLLALLSLPAGARVGAGMRLGFQDPAFCINFFGDFEITRNIDITADFDIITAGTFTGQLTGNFKYTFAVPSVNPYAGMGLGIGFSEYGASFLIPLHVGMQIPLGAGFYLDAEVRPVIGIGEGAGFSFGFIAGVLYFF